MGEITDSYDSDAPSINDQEIEAASDFTESDNEQPEEDAQVDEEQEEQQEPVRNT